MKPTEHSGGRDDNVYVLFSRQVARRPESTAIIERSGSTSYGALEARAVRIAEAISALRLPMEAPIGVLMHRTADLVATLLGIFRAGGCYLPLEPDDPPDRIRRVVTESRAAIVIGNGALLSKLYAANAADPNPRVLPSLVDVDELVDQAPASVELPRELGGRQLAYVMFTSGSTGAPKGVEVEQRSVVNLLEGARDLLEFSASDRYLAVATIGFDISVAELFLPLVTGGTIVLRDRQLLLDPHDLAAEILHYGVTVFQTGPSVWAVLLSEVVDFPSLRIAISTGEALPPRLAQRLVRVGGAVWNLYGPTETTVWATGHRLDRQAETEGLLNESVVSVPIGRPLRNIEVRVLDDHLRPVPPGREGGLWIGGIALARGYHDRPDLTEERFVRFEDDGGIFYRTGDIVAADATGALHYYGRDDDQIKVRGLRIEPMEVEAAILRVPGVQRAAVTWFETAGSGRGIVAAIVADGKATVDGASLHRALSRELPAAMIPSRFVFCTDLPRAASGKIDRRAIRDRAATAADRPDFADGTRELTETERFLAEIWQRTLEIAAVGRSDHFFTIGGDSLSAVTMALEVESVFQISLAVRTVFERPTLEELARHIDSVRAQPDEIEQTTFIFPLSKQGEGCPVFFSSVDLRLARTGLWRADCPLYAVSLWAQGSGFVSARSIEELARTHVDGIRALQPQGPYRLAGYSFGGMIALEIAQQLRAIGETVELLFLLDPGEPWTLERGSEAASPVAERGHETLAARLRRHAGQIARHPASALEYLGSRVRTTVRHALRISIPATWRPVWEWLNYQLVHLHGRHANPVSTLLLPKNRWPAFWYASKRLGEAYVPRPYEGKVLAVFAERGNSYSLWRPLLGEAAEIRIVPAAHTGFFSDPVITEWLEMLRARLDAPT